jgi:sulfonate transport system substrate-binding protein
MGGNYIMRRKIGVLLGVFALSLGLLTGCGATEDASDAAGTTAENTDAAGESEDSTDSGDELVIRIADQPGFYPVRIAQEEGFFEKELEGLNARVEVVEYTGGGPAVTESFTAGEIEFGLLGDLPVAAAVVNGTDIKIISWSATKGKADVLVSKEGSGIDSVADLAGKKVGVAVGQIIHGELIKLLENNGLSINDVELVNLSNDDITSSVESGDIDAGMNYLEKIVSANENGSHIQIIADGDGLGFANIVFAGRTEFTEEYPEITAAILKALDEADQYKLENKDDTIATLAEATGYPETTFEQTYPAYDNHVTIGEDERSAVQTVLDFGYENGLITSQLTVDDVIDTQYLEKAGLQ